MIQEYSRAGHKFAKHNILFCSVRLPRSIEKVLNCEIGCQQLKKVLNLVKIYQKLIEKVWKFEFSHFSFNFFYR